MRDPKRGLEFAVGRDMRRARGGSIIAVSSVLFFACTRDQGGVIRERGRLSITPDALDFGNVVVDGRAESKLMLSNDGVRPIDICLAHLADEHCTTASGMEPIDTPFQWPLPDMVWALAPGDSPSFSLAFAPGSVGSFEAKLTLGHDGANGPALVIPLRGSAVLPALEVTVSALDFGRVRLGRPSTRAVTLFNRTTPGARVTVHARIETSSAAFAMIGENGKATNDALFNIEANGSAVINVRLLPGAEQGYVSQLDLQYCTSCALSVPLTGSGAEARMEVAPQQLDFGSHPDRMPASRTFKIRSIGTATVAITELSPLDVDTFIIDGVAVPFEIPPGREVEVAVTHNGNHPGLEIGRLSVVSDAVPVARAEIQLVAEALGPNIDPRPRALMFGRVRPNAIPVERSIAIRNIGNQALTVSSIRATQNADFSLVLPVLPAEIDPNGSLAFSVRFLPAADGRSATMLAISSDDLDEGTLVIPVAGEGGDPTGCAIFVSPAAIELGSVERGLGFTVPLSVTNLGSSDCTLADLALSGVPPFSLPRGQMPSLTIAPNAVQEIPVEYLSVAYGPSEGTLSAATNDMSLGTLRIPITAQADQLGLRVLPKEVNLGKIPVNCRSPLQKIRIENLGPQTTVQSSILDTFDSAAFSITGLNAPVRIDSGAFIELNLRYQPIDIGSDVAILSLRSSDNVPPAVVVMRGAGRAAGRISEDKRSGLAAKVDLLFVVEDGNGSSGTAQLRAQIPALLSFADAGGVDYHVGAVGMDPCGNRDDGALLRGGGVAFVDRQTPNSAAVLSSNLDFCGGGRADGFEAAFLALSDPLLNEANVGFLRPDADLSVVFVSSRDDESRLDIGFYEEFLRYLKRGVPQAVTISAIVGTDAGACFSNGLFAEHASQLIDMTDRMGGVALSYCGDWAQTVSRLEPYAFGLSRAYSLSSPAVASSLDVRVGNQSVPSATSGVTAWIYDPLRTRVLFTSEAAPAPRSNVHISYMADCP
jgi:centrosomal CEP192-like protein